MRQGGLLYTVSSVVPLSSRGPFADFTKPRLLSVASKTFLIRTWSLGYLGPGEFTGSPAKVGLHGVFWSVCFTLSHLHFELPCLGSFPSCTGRFVLCFFFRSILSCLIITPSNGGSSEVLLFFVQIFHIVHHFCLVF